MKPSFMWMLLLFKVWQYSQTICSKCKLTLMMMMMLMMMSPRSQGKDREAVTLLKDSIRFGPHFADAYSSLASLYAEQVKHPEKRTPSLTRNSSLFQKGERATHSHALQLPVTFDVVHSGFNPICNSSASPTETVC